MTATTSVAQSSACKWRRGRGSVLRTLASVVEATEEGDTMTEEEIRTCVARESATVTMVDMTVATTAAATTAVATTAVATTAATTVAAMVATTTAEVAAASMTDLVAPVLRPHRRDASCRYDDRRGGYGGDRYHDGGRDRSPPPRRYEEDYDRRDRRDY
eukprot:scaffold779_cov355-Prasinococcus_capsulatus_cf.AAC.4